MPWEHRGKGRPAFAIEPGPGQESVWDYPRPPRLVADPRPVEVRIGEALLARSSHAIRVLETASPPTFYLLGCDPQIALHVQRPCGVIHLTDIAPQVDLHEPDVDVPALPGKGLQRGAGRLLRLEEVSPRLGPDRPWPRAARSLAQGSQKGLPQTGCAHPVLGALYAPLTERLLNA